MINQEYIEAEPFVNENCDGVALSNQIKNLILECNALMPEENGKFFISCFRESYPDDYKKQLLVGMEKTIYFPTVIEKVKEILSPIYDEVTYETLEKFFKYDSYNEAENFYNALLQCKQYLLEKYQIEA